MAINSGDNFNVTTSLHLDKKWGPYSGNDETEAIASANASIDPLTRFEGLTVGLKISTNDIVEYWYLGGTSDTDLVLKTSESGTVTLSENSGLTFSQNDLDTLYNTTIDDTLEVPSDVGGISAGTTAGDLKSKNLVQIFDDLLFPTVLPTYTNPTNVLSPLPGIANLEVGTTYSATITQTAKSNDAGDFIELRIYRNSVLVDTDSSPVLSSGVYTNTYNENFLIGQPTNNDDPFVLSYSSEGDYLAGDPKTDNKGVIDSRTPQVRSINAPQASDTGFQSNTRIANAYFPYFWGTYNTTISDPQEIVTEIEAGNSNKVVSNSGGTLTINAGTSIQFVWLAVPSDTPLKTEWYDTALVNGNIGAPGDTFDESGDRWVAFDNGGAGYSIDSPDGYWTGVTYTIYLQKPSAGGAGLTNPIQFRV